MDNRNSLGNLAEGNEWRIVEGHASVDFIGNDRDLVLLAKLNKAFHVILLEDSAGRIGRIDENHGAGLFVDGVFETIVVDRPVLKTVSIEFYFNILPGWDRDRSICI